MKSHTTGQGPEEARGHSNNKFQRKNFGTHTNRTVPERLSERNNILRRATNLQSSSVRGRGRNRRAAGWSCGATSAIPKVY